MYAHKGFKYQPNRSMEIIEGLMRALDVPAKPQVPKPSRAIWRPHGVGGVKLNTDGAIDVSKGCAGDHNGAFIAGRCTQYLSITDPFVCEALACRPGCYICCSRLRKDGFERPDG